ncbi:WXG100 family type VII secretion target [Nonomuraea thailandensis]|uniref:WXG100 family type VII secretion target n=1 Tax=Nonomuraea thailandensis TaxID=1188745 RepID=A0A9X2GQ37_9ACTN|nr:WXG100 family type VII secretion target [Nonomuraea thailandensis]MCP2361950.1 WXG100 family type VII secretion target [Nonomuraea thailandensis]
MSAREGIRELPDGPTLADLADEVSGSPSSIRDIAARWRAAATRVSTGTGTLGGAVSTVDLAWEGESADAFVGYMSKYGKAGQDLHDALVACAEKLEQAADTLESSRRVVDGICDRLLTRVGTYKQNNPDAEQEELDEQIGRWVNAEITVARPTVQEARDAVNDAKDALGTLMSERDTTFRQIGPAGEEKFTPDSGHRFDWRRTESYTAQTAAGGPGGSPVIGGGPGGYGPSGLPPAGGGPAPTGQVKEWIEQAIAILREHGYPADKMNPSDIWMVIQHESGGNPNAINLWDSNAAAGHPSKGLMQTIDPTFDAYSLGGSIYDPVSNIVAGVRYAIERYGSISAVPGVVGMKTGAGYSGY